MYRVFEALDELGVIVEEARGVPMTAGCVVPRGDVLELIDDVKDAIPGELDDAQDVLDARDSLLNEAKEHSGSMVATARAEADSMLNHARTEADRLLADAKAQADRMVAEARQHSERMVGEAREEAARISATAKREYEASAGRAKAEADRLIESGNLSYEKAVQEGIKEQQRLVSQTETVQSANAEATRLIDAAHAEVGPDTVAKVLFTSGSTGRPKGVINTQRMWCSNQEMITNQLAYFRDEPPIILDWSPWHHTASGNHNIGFVIYNGGTYYIDEGKPAPGAIEVTVRNLREVATTWYFTVPKGYEVLLPYLRSDAGLRKTFFSRLKVLWFAGAALSQSVFDEMQALAEESCGVRIMFLTGLGSTETAPMAIARMWQSEDSTNMGVPVPGVELKLVPSDGKLEARVRGPNVMPGYWRQPELTAKVFDDEGYYCLGDAVKFEDPADARKGLLFDGRIAEDFKLATGTWVSVGPLRARFLSHFAPYAKDVVIAGADRGDIRVLVFPDLEACRRLAPDLPAGASATNIVSDPRVRAVFWELLGTLAKASTGSSNRITAAILLAEPPSLDAGEITDKGSINQRAVLRCRATEVAEIYSAPMPPHVIAIEKRD